MSMVSVVIPACTGGGEQATTDFVVDNPANAEGGSDPGSGDGTGGSATAGDEGDAGEDGGDGEREVSEADIVFIEGDKLYALSAYSGLAVVDVSAPSDALPVLGRHRLQSQPFEMYVDNGQVFAILSEYGSYEWDEAAEAYMWRSASRLVALDASNPADIAVRGEFEIPGYVQDSRRVGDILYLVTYEDGWCWGCRDQEPRTVVTSLDVSNPAAVEVVDQLAFANQTDDEWDWSGPRSVSSTNERLYVGGIEYDGWDDAHSIIDVVDITDPGGVMAKGASVQVAGSIESRWQMDEHEGVLRVISQPWGWNTDIAPKIETFTVASASEVVPLGSLTMTLPRPETLQSVRFDGPRAYAITFEQTDPLFTLDLADPAAPQQVGELEIPGWIHHMEPRGDRILALGFDPDNEAGAVNVSLFDVSDFAQPAMISRVSFGGDWAYFAEDQNRIHKAFTILDELGLLLVPFSGWQYDEGEGGECANGSYQSGIQLVDWANDTLALRGVAPSHGQARRALVHRERLIAMSDKRLEAFDITNRDAPASTAALALAANVSAVAVGDGIVVRLASDWYSDDTAIEVVSAADPESPEPLGRVALDEVAVEFNCGSWPIDLFVHGDHAYLLREVYTYEADSYESRLVLDTISIAEPSAPVWQGAIDLPFAQGWGGSGIGLRNEEKMAVIVGDAFVFATSDSDYDGESYVGQQGTIEVVDLSAPDAPSHVASLERADASALGALLVFDDTVVSWHMLPVDGDESKVRFYLDRFDVSSPASPQAADPINVPGQVVGYDADNERVVTVGFQREQLDLVEEDCWSHPKQWNYDWETQDCFIAHRPLHLLALDGDGAELLDTLDLEGSEGRLDAVMITDQRLFAEISHGDAWGWYDDDGDGLADPSEQPSDQIAVITGHTGDGLVERARVDLGNGIGWASMFGVTGTRALFQGDAGIGSIDASVAEAPTVAVTPHKAYGCWNPEIGGDAVYCPLGEYGLQVIAMP